MEALALPAGARLDRRVPKKLLVENGAPTAADRRHINSGVDELVWVAALKPATAAVPAYRDDTREYLEIAVLSVALRPGAKADRIVALVHRAVPYPVLLVTQGQQAGISLAHKRWCQGEAGKTVLDGAVVAADWDGARDGPHEVAFRHALSLGRQPRASLFTLYHGWMHVVLALQAARRTGTFAIPTSAEHAAARRAAIDDCARLEAEIARLRAAAARQKQLRRQVELNLELDRVQAARAAAYARL
ncbi:MAG: DUF4391 domain-containing protein [Deltaproteobacteria bacterium]|nr:DUF4391 domain-containing protein [Deltaproteobacteria bacterium]